MTEGAKPGRSPESHAYGHVTSRLRSSSSNWFLTDDPPISDSASSDTLETEPSDGGDEELHQSPDSLQEACPMAAVRPAASTIRRPPSHDMS